MKRAGMLLSAAIISTVLIAPSASAKSFTTTTAADTADAAPGNGRCADAQGRCSLRAAVQEANALTGADTIRLKKAVYRLTLAGADDVGAQGDLDVTGPLVVVGSGAGKSIIDADLPERVFDIISGGTTVSGVTVTGGDAVAWGFGGGIHLRPGAGFVLKRSAVIGNVAGGGGGIASYGQLRIEDSLIQGNRADSGGPVNPWGGGLRVIAGTASVARSAIIGNTAFQSGGGISHAPELTDPPTLAVTDSTVSGNEAGGGGGLMVQNGSATLRNLTITGNTANPGTGRGGISFFTCGGCGHAVSIRNTIVAENAGASPADNCGGDALTSGGGNIEDANTCGFGPSDRVSTSPRLGPLAPNGGPTRTRALLGGSPAIGFGVGSCSATDQRGAPRKDCDSGAYERVFCGGVLVNRVGTSGRDALVGTSGRDGMLGRGGKDRLSGRGASDGLCGGGGGDRLAGGGGRDVIRGGGGGDRIFGGPGSDRCIGGRGDNRLESCER